MQSVFVQLQSRADFLACALQEESVQDREDDNDSVRRKEGGLQGALMRRLQRCVRAHGKTSARSILCFQDTQGTNRLESPHLLRCGSPASLSPYCLIRLQRRLPCASHLK